MKVNDLIIQQRTLLRDFMLQSKVEKTLMYPLMIDLCGWYFAGREKQDICREFLEESFQSYHSSSKNCITECLKEAFKDGDKQDSESSENAKKFVEEFMEGFKNSLINLTDNLEKNKEEKK